MVIAIIFTAALIGLAIDAKRSDAHCLAVSRLYRKIRKVQRANELTRLNNAFYVNQIGK